jgi:MFS family permease
MLSRRHLVTYFGIFLGPFGGIMVLALLKPLKSDFNVGIDELQIAIPFFMIPFAIVQLFSGALSDIYNRRITVMIGFLLYAMGSVLCAWAPMFSIFLGARIVQGIGFAFVSPVLLALIGDITPRENRGKAMGIASASTTLGSASGPAVAGFLAAIDWRLAFYLSGLLSVVEIFILWAAFKEYRPKKVKSSGLASDLKEVASNRNIALLSTAGFMMFFCFVGTQTYLADFQSTRFSEEEIGIMLSSTGFAGIFFALVAGYLVDRMGRKKIAVAGLLLMSLSFFLLTFWDDYVPITMNMAFFGITNTMAWSAIMTMVVEVAPRHRGAASSFFNSARFFGFAISPPVFLIVYQSFNVQSVYIIASILILFAVAVISAIRLPKKKKAKSSLSDE